jgi:ATP-dependent helicase/nuclease subunit B
VQTERLALDALQRLVPDAYARHWQITLQFLTILTEHWPRILADEACIDPAERRNLVMQAQADAWRREPPPHPIIAAGSTGSIPATADLLAVVAGLPHGAVVLPGLDRHADPDSWQAIHDEPTHPQHGLARLLDRLGVDRDAVADWPTPGPTTAVSVAARAQLASEAMRPAATSEAWQDLRRSGIAAEALDGVTRLDCPGPREEAETIALIMRQTLEQPAWTAALVTPDRDLARRVAAALRRWGIRVDDSAGMPLAETVPGGFLRLVATMLAERLAPVSLLACLKHPLAAGGRPLTAFRALARRLEIAALRGPRPEPGFAGLKAALGGSDRELGGWVDELAGLTAPFDAALQADTVALSRLIEAHVAVAERLAATADDAGAERLWAGAAGEAAAGFIAELAEAAADFPPLAGHHYPALFEALMAGRVVRPRYGRHPRLFIWGPLEARLQQADRLILGGLNEGAWPPEAAADPWLSRPMRAEFGLPLPERRIGLSAHDFAQGFCARQVVLTRAQRVEGTPTVPSRWLLRLDNVLAAAGLGQSWEAKRGDEWLAWQAALDRPERPAPWEPPAPRPPLAARPRTLSVTRIETWMRDPYAIYARYVLGLKPLEPLDADPGAAAYGEEVHKALDRFVREHPGALPADAEARLIAIGRETFARYLGRPGVWAFWWPRFERIARWFVAREAERRAEIVESVTEVRGSLTIDTAHGPFTLTAFADRIDRMRDGSLTVVDYKTGAPPSLKEVEAGYAPQLPLEAAIAAAGGFDGVAAAPIGGLSYWRLRGDEPAGEENPLKADAPALAAAALDGLGQLIIRFDEEATPYRARPRPDAAPRFSDYEHLARVKEWSAGAGEDTE